MCQKIGTSSFFTLYGVPTTTSAFHSRRDLHRCLPRPHKKVEVVSVTFDTTPLGDEEVMTIPSAT